MSRKGSDSQGILVHDDMVGVRQVGAKRYCQGMSMPSVPSANRQSRGVQCGSQSRSQKGPGLDWPGTPRCDQLLVYKDE
jgi:hypothetical protein